MESPGEPRLSVLVPAYGVAQYLGDALRSLQAQSCEAWEAIVVDDGAPDDVAGAVAPFANDPRIRLLKTDNGGLSVARNRAAAIARAPWVSLLDGDDIYEPTYIQAMLAAVERDPGLDFVTCDATYFGADRAGQLFSAYHSQAAELTLATVLNRTFNVFVGCTVRREALLAVGGFDERLRSVEDLDLWIRLLAAEYRGKSLPEPLVRYRRRAGSLSSDGAAMRQAAREVYFRATALLDGRPEQADAQNALARLDDEQSWHDGEELILAGDVREGLTLMHGAEHRSVRWQIAMPVMRLFPALAKLILRVRERLPEPKRR